MACWSYIPRQWAVVGIAAAYFPEPHFVVEIQGWFIIQRHLQIGYNRAARIIDRMEADGVISGANHVGKREILASNTNVEY